MFDGLWDVSELDDPDREERVFSEDLVSESVVEVEFVLNLFAFSWLLVVFWRLYHQDISLYVEDFVLVWVIGLIAVVPISMVFLQVLRECVDSKVRLFWYVFSGKYLVTVATIAAVILGALYVYGSLGNQWWQVGFLAMYVVWSIPRVMRNAVDNALYEGSDM